MNFLTAATRLRKEAIKDAKTLAECNNEEDYVKYIEQCKNHKLEIFKDNYKLAVQMMLCAREINEEMGLCKPNQQRMFFITIRPKCDSTTFDAFYILITKLMNRNCFSNYYVTFEQKGTNDESLGHGFHTHIITCATQRGKAEVLRDVHSTVKGCTEKHCIQVDITYNGENMFQNYCIDYESKDGHKVSTKLWDQKWRSKIGLADYYKNELPNRVPAIKSVAGPLVIEME